MQTPAAARNKISNISLILVAVLLIGYTGWLVSFSHVQDYLSASANQQFTPGVKAKTGKTWAIAKQLMVDARPINATSVLLGSAPKVCILIPVTSRMQDWKAIEDTFVYRMPLSSLVKTCEPHKFSYSVFIGYDVGDTFFDNHGIKNALKQWVAENVPFVSLKIEGFVNELQKPGPQMNFLSRKAYDDNCDFMYRINDDTEFMTPWTSAFVDALQTFSPPLRGVVGPTCNEGNTAILTHDFVHRSHLDIFPTHYPPELTDWWLDDWITKVYGESNTKKLAEVTVRHHVLVTRYEVRWESEKSVNSLLEQGQLRIRNMSMFQNVSV